MLAIAAAVVIISAVVGISKYQAEAARKKESYAHALALRDEGKYADAVSIFNELGNYKDCIELKNDSKYQAALICMEEKKYDKAFFLFYDLGDYKDSRNKTDEAHLRFMVQDFSKDNETYRYFIDHRDDYYKLSVSEIQALLPGEWSLKYANSSLWGHYTFTNDGKRIQHSYGKDYTNYRHTDENYFYFDSLGNGSSVDTYEVRKIFDDTYIFYELDQYKKDGIFELSQIMIKYEAKN